MLDKQTPFYAQAAILDEYIHAEDPSSDPIALEIVLEVLKERSNLRQYFFSQGPTAAWAEIFWEHDFFQTPPSPQATEAGYVLERWDVQEFLISVAGQVPDIVVKHVETIQGNPRYIAQAINALRFIPSEKIEPLIPIIIKWLEEAQFARVIALDVFELIKALVEKTHVDAAFKLFDVLIAPLPPTNVKDVEGYAWSAVAESKFRSSWYEDEILSGGLDLFGELDPQRIAPVLETHLCTTLHLEALVQDRPKIEFTSWWRVAIEETDQDIHKDYKDKLLEALRDLMEKWIENDPVEAKELLERYLKDNHEILHRLGLHLLHTFPGKLLNFVVQELPKKENLNNVGIHHEFFLLLQNGYPYLSRQDQQMVITSICEGPPVQYVQKLAGRAERDYGEDLQKYTEGFTKKWIFDRLWMLRDHLEGEPKKLLRDLTSELGEPDHPAFTRWSTGVYRVQEVSPLNVQELAHMSPDALVKFVQGWQPGREREVGPFRTSYTGLANDVANLIADDVSKYSEHLFVISLQRPEFAYAIFDQYAKDDQVNVPPWHLIIDLCENLLALDTVRESVDYNTDVSWVSVRKAIIRLLETGLSDEQPSIPDELLSRVRDIFISLVDDSDPSFEMDDPAEGWFGHNDPATVAINHVRSSALIGLIEYARRRAQIVEQNQKDDIIPRHLDPIVNNILSKKLDKRSEPSKAVHSIYGKYLPLLHWFDPQWVEVHLEQIFPKNNDEEAIRFFITSWDSFVIFNRFYPSLLKLLYPHYQHAIFNMSQGFMTQTHLEPAKRLAIHLGWEYLDADYDLLSPVGQQSLIVEFFEQAPPETRSKLTWWLWRVCEQNKSSELERIWPRVRALWEWRTQKASVANHINTFDNEMEWFAHLPVLAPKTETIESLWPLLTGLLPHVTRSESQDMGWRSLENYLAKEVETDPVRAIRLYRMMYDQITERRWFHDRPEIQKIIETGASDKRTHQEVLDLIDSMARIGIHHYRNIYEQFQ